MDIIDEDFILIFSVKTIMQEVRGELNSHSFHKKSKSIVIDNLKRKLKAITGQSKSPSRSPSKNVSQQSHLTSISNFQQIDQLKGMSKLALGKERMGKIKHTLSIQQECRRNYQNRKKNKDFYFKYNPHSFSISKQDKGRSSEQLAKENIERYKQYQGNQLVKVVFDLRSKQRFRQINIQKYDREGLERNLLNRIKQINSFKKQPVQKEKNLQNDSHLNVASFIVDFLDGPSPLDQLDSIIGIKEESFFSKKLKAQEINIFQFRKHPEAKCFMSGWQQLKQHNFSFDSVKPLINKQFNEQIERNLSTYSRISAINGESRSIAHSFKLTQKDEAMEPSNLSLKYILLLASGQMLPSILRKAQKQFYNSDDKEADISLVEITNMTFKPNHKNELIHKQERQGEGKSDLRDYFKLPLTAKQNYVVKNSHYWQEKLEKLMKIQAKYKNNNISDQVLGANYQHERRSVLVEQLGGINQDRQQPEEAERRIRMNKLRKDKSERLKLEAVKKSVQLNKKFERRLNSKSPIKITKKI